MNSREKAIAGASEGLAFSVDAARRRVFRDSQHYGAIVAGKFYRGGAAVGDGKWVDALDRDRVRGLQLMVPGMDLLGKEANAKPDDVGHFYQDLASMLIEGSNGADAWRLQFLTDLTQVPDYEESARYYGRWGGWQPGRGAPVDAKGNPIYHAVPEQVAGRGRRRMGSGGGGR